MYLRPLSQWTAYELTHAFISAVYIYDLDNIEIVWKFKDFLTTSEGEAK